MKIRGVQVYAVKGSEALLTGSFNNLIQLGGQNWDRELNSMSNMSNNKCYIMCIKKRNSNLRLSKPLKQLFKIKIAIVLR